MGREEDFTAPTSTFKGQSDKRSWKVVYGGKNPGIRGEIQKKIEPWKVKEQRISRRREWWLHLMIQRSAGKGLKNVSWFDK